MSEGAAQGEADVSEGAAQGEGCAVPGVRAQARQLAPAAATAAGGEGSRNMGVSVNDVSSAAHERRLTNHASVPEKERAGYGETGRHRGKDRGKDKGADKGKDKGKDRGKNRENENAYSPTA